MVWFHADDYGINLEQSKRIIESAHLGVLNSVSVIPNSKYLSQCMKLLENEKISWSVHINLVEGKCCADKNDVRMLTTEDGKFKLTFSQLFLLSMIKWKTLKAQVAKECAAQIKTVRDAAGNDFVLKLDSHRHYHMLPVVMSGLCEACNELNMKPEFIRWSVEPIKPFIWRGTKIAGMNLMKNLVLSLCGMADKLILRRNKIYCHKKAVLFGVLYSGKMTYDIVEKLKPYFIKYSLAQNKDLEILFHPGAIYDGEEYLDKEYVDFYQSPDREDERQTLIRLKGVS